MLTYQQVTSSSHTYTNQYGCIAQLHLSCRVTPFITNIELTSSEEGDHLPSLSHNLSHINTIDERAIDGPISLSHTLFREDYAKKKTPSPSLEEPPRSPRLLDIDTPTPTLLQAGVVPPRVTPFTRIYNELL